MPSERQAKRCVNALRPITRETSCRRIDLSLTRLQFRADEPDECRRHRRRGLLRLAAGERTSNERFFHKPRRTAQARGQPRSAAPAGGVRHRRPGAGVNALIRRRLTQARHPRNKLRELLDQGRLSDLDPVFSSGRLDEPFRYPKRRCFSQNPTRSCAAVGAG